MDQIIVGVDTHKSSHIAVAINTQGARLGVITILPLLAGIVALMHGRPDWAASKPLASKAPALTVQVCPGICRPRATPF